MPVEARMNNETVEIRITEPADLGTIVGATASMIVDADGKTVELQNQSSTGFWEGHLTIGEGKLGGPDPVTVDVLFKDKSSQGFHLRKALAPEWQELEPEERQNPTGQRIPYKPS